MRRTLVAIVAAALLVALNIGLVYGFFVYVWPNLPPWLSMLCFIALAVFVIGSPIFWLLQLSRNTPLPPHLLKKRGR
jgi:hypothetical protein